jgi:hypothetical protein
MIRTHPYNTWPLQVKAFTREADKAWTTLSKTIPLPPGLVYTVELEGVDGKSGLVGSGRTGPIDVADCASFDLSYFDVNTSMSTQPSLPRHTSTKPKLSGIQAHSSSAPYVKVQYTTSLW